MKKLIALVTLVAAMSAFAGSTTKYGTLRVKGGSEAEVIANAEAMIPSILDASNRTIRRDMMSEGCWLRARNMILGELKVHKSFVSNDQVTFEPKYSGTIRYGVKRCRDER